MRRQKQPMEYEPCIDKGDGLVHILYRHDGQDRSKYLPVPRSKSAQCPPGTFSMAENTKTNWLINESSPLTSFTTVGAIYFVSSWVSPPNTTVPFVSLSSCCTRENACGEMSREKEAGAFAGVASG